MKLAVYAVHVRVFSISPKIKGSRASNITSLANTSQQVARVQGYIGNSNETAGKWEVRNGVGVGMDAQSGTV